MSSLVLGGVLGTGCGRDLYDRLFSLCQGSFLGEKVNKCFYLRLRGYYTSFVIATGVLNLNQVTYYFQGFLL